MSEFDIFFDDYENKHNCSPEKYECFEAGQQSQQGEVDKLQTEIDELQARIDVAIGSLKLVNHALLYEHIDHIINLLDGTTNEQ